MIHVQGRRIETFTLGKVACITSTGEKDRKALQAQYACCVTLQCRPHWEVLIHGQGSSRPTAQQAAAMLFAVSNECVMCLCFAAHDIRDTSFHYPSVGKSALFHCKGKWLL